MFRTCPFCKSKNARRSRVRKSETTLRHTFLSPYRCRVCGKQFWMPSRNSCYLAGLIGVTAVFSGLVWNPSILSFDGSRPKPAPVTAVAPSVADLVKLANDKDPVAELELARLYAIGEGVPRSLPEELKWLGRAAQHGNVDAQYEYAIALRDGHGTVQDYNAARRWMQVAAEGSSGPAQFALGMMYRSGLGIPVDNVKAYVWLNVAAAQGVPGAAGARDAVLSRLTLAESQDAQAEARRLSEIYIPKAGATQ